MLPRSWPFALITIELLPLLALANSKFDTPSLSVLVTVNSTDKDGVSNLELANASNGNSSIVIKANGQERGNIVVYSGVTYYKDYTDGKWFKFGPNDANKPQTVDLKKEFLK